jgi:hypothetical protein
MLSAVYQLSGDANQAAFDKDSGNRLYWRVNRRRMTAEQIRDSLLAVSGALDSKMGGPSAPLTALSERRTVYGKISRYKLDEYLQLFDFPSPNLSAEKRFTTSVPLQRLFFMNSDFMQQQAERVARRLVSEPDNKARIQAAYRAIFGRAPSNAEWRAGLAFIGTEPLKDYEERKAAAAKSEKEANRRDSASGKNDKKTAPTGDGAGPGDAGDNVAEDGTAKPDAAEGMMAGVLPGAVKTGDQKKLLPVTPWGRYVKILLSSNEFLFVN